VLGDILGANYVVDPEVQGLVTLRTAEALPRNAVLPTLESILRINGIVLVERDDVYSILPASKAPATYSNLGSEAYQGQVRGHSVQVYPLRYATASAVYQILQPFLGPDQRVVVDDARNVLIFSGTTQELRDLQELAGVFDVDWMKGMSFALLPVEMTDSVTMATEMQTVFGEGLGGPSQGMIRFIPIERLNAVLAISPQASYLKQAELWIERLDRRDQRAGRQIFVYYVKNGRAVELAEILSQVFEESPRRLETEFLAPGAQAVTLGEAPQLAEAPGGPGTDDAGGPPPLPPVAFAGESLAGGGGIQVFDMSAIDAGTVTAAASITGEIPSSRAARATAGLHSGKMSASLCSSSTSVISQFSSKKRTTSSWPRGVSSKRRTWPSIASTSTSAPASPAERSSSSGVESRITYARRLAISRLV